MTDAAVQLQSVLTALRSAYPDAANAAPCACAVEPDDPVLGQFLISFLMWETTTSKAVAAAKRLEQAVVDCNELRICLPDDTIGILGERYAKSAERAERLRAALHEIYRREHAVTLTGLSGMPKREARAYLETLDGVPSYVAARVVLLSLGGHAAPVDTRIGRALAGVGLADKPIRTDAASSMLERRIRAGDLSEAYMLLQVWADDGGKPIAMETAAPAPVSADRPTESTSDHAQAGVPPSDDQPKGGA